jgi:hypothetical protein
MKAELEHGVLGLQWGMSAEQVMKAYPDAKETGRPSRPMVAVNNPAGLWGAHPKQGLFLLSVSPDKGFTEAHFVVPVNEVAEFVSRLKEVLGEARTLSVKDITVYTQALEWSTPLYGISIWYATKDESPLQPVFQAQVTVKHGPLTESFIDEYQRRSTGSR